MTTINATIYHTFVLRYSSTDDAAEAGSYLSERLPNDAQWRIEVRGSEVHLPRPFSVHGDVRDICADVALIEDVTRLVACYHGHGSPELRHAAVRGLSLAYNEWRLAEDLRIEQEQAAKREARRRENVRKNAEREARRAARADAANNKGGRRG